jgi:hypothetical protein
MEEPDPISRRAEAVAGHGGRRIFLSYVVRTQFISLFDIYVWPGNLARLSLLLRSRDVGHRTFCVPPLVFLQPDAAQNILDYRFRNLESARNNARLMGRRGLQFPWESAPTSGEEAAPMPGSAAWREDHGSLDIARAFALCANVTGSEAFLDEKAWPVLSGVAEGLRVA